MDQGQAGVVGRNASSTNAADFIVVGLILLPVHVDIGGEAEGAEAVFCLEEVVRVLRARHCSSMLRIWRDP
ncbi:hypothetical protein PG991_011938 [Apiospora marii]|uniref:Uncharacterized protein n=1 Tax=Apiospora marii TaxID=335849 RepID=A0ABR1RFI4_9PEZI